MKHADEGIEHVRDVRRRISEEFRNDPAKLVEHYIAEQERYRDRILKPVTAPREE